MKRDLESRIDEISNAFEQWAKEVADRIVEAAQKGADQAAKAREAVHQAREEFANNDGGGDSEESESDPWSDWARMRNETWEKWASGKFEQPLNGSIDTETIRNAFRQAQHHWNTSMVGQFFDEFLRSAESMMQNARNNTRDTEQAGDEIIGQLVEVEVEATEPKKEPAATKAASAASTIASDADGLSKYAQSLVDRIKKLDRKSKPKKWIKTLIAELESDLKKRAKSDKQKKGKK